MPAVAPHITRVSTRGSERHLPELDVSHLSPGITLPTSPPKDVRRRQLRIRSVRLPLLVSFPVNEIRACLKEFGRTCLRKEFLRESEGSLQGERSMPKLHCCNISHGGGIREVPQVVSGDVRRKCCKHSHRTLSERGQCSRHCWG